MESICDAAHRRDVGRDTGCEDDESLLLAACGRGAVVLVERIEFRVVQIAALGRRPGRVGCHGDHAPVGEFPSTVFRKATSGLRNTAIPMSAAPRLGSDRRVYDLSVRLAFRPPCRTAISRVGIRHGTQDARQLSLMWRNRVRTDRYRLSNAERCEAMYAERAYLPGAGT